MLVPFAEIAQLNHQLKVEANAQSPYNLVRADCSKYENLPGQPRMRLRSSSLHHSLEREFCTPDLDTLSPHLWLVATQSSSHISPLHEHILKGRHVAITEDQELHLTWTNNRVFIKPMPRYMLSYAFWTAKLVPDTNLTKCANAQTPSEALLRAALGFMRTYYYLVRHESDLRIANESCLVSFDRDNVTIEEFHEFISGFAEIQDDEVSPRYSSYGTLGLSRLNFWAKFFLRRFQFYQVDRQYSEYFARFYAPILFFFGILTVALSAMQVGLQADDVAHTARERWAALQSVSFWFSVVTLLCICAIGLIISLVFSFMLVRELAFAAKDLVRRNWENAKAQATGTCLP